MSDNNVFYSPLLKREFSDYKKYHQELYNLVNSKEWMAKHKRIHPSRNTYSYTYNRGHFINDNCMRNNRFIWPYFHRKFLKIKGYILFPDQIYKVIKGTRKFTITDKLCGFRAFYHSTKSVCYLDKIEIIDSEFLAREKLELELNEKEETLGYYNMELEDILDSKSKYA